MNTQMRCNVLAAIFVLFASISGAAPARAADKLAGYNAAIGESSISGISSGAFMAVQFATAWSSVITGVGIVAGGPYWCAKADNTFGYWTSMLDYTASVLNATGPCMKGPLPDVGPFVAKADAKAAAGEIDPLLLLRRQKVYVFHGYNDKTVTRDATDAAAAFYRHYLGDANRGNLYYQTAVGAGHSLVVVQDSPTNGLNECKESEAPFIDACRYDQAGVILQHIYGPLTKPGPEPLTGTVKPFDQSFYTGSGSPSSLSLGRIGYVFVPKACESNEACRVHIALHGCKQHFDDPKVGRAFVDRTGYNAWADANRLIVLYPQTAVSNFFPWYPSNSDACWDWWGYIKYNDNYVTKAGLQIKAIKAMLDALTSGAVPATAPSPAGAQIALTVIDTSDTAADLVWPPHAGATGYRIWRATAGGPFAPIADVSAPGFADSGLAPTTAYKWRVAPLTGGVEGSPSADAEAVTRATVVCANPGLCPWKN